MAVRSVDFSDVQAAAKRLVGVVNRTPVMTSRTLDEAAGAECFVKSEAHQRAGAFKFRGANNALFLLSEEQRAKGVLTFSSGNFAGALALAGRQQGVQVVVVMPEDAPKVKYEATKGYGAEVILYDREQMKREDLGPQIAEERGLTIVHPYDDPDIIAGQGTAAMEMIEDHGPLDALLVPCGGGGLLSGCAIAAKGLNAKTRVIGVEPANADDATRSFRSGELHTVHNPDTIADGARTPYLGRHTFPLVMDHVDEFATVSEDAIVRATHFLWERMKLFAEPTGALAVAALLSGEVRPTGRVGVVVSGGNVDLPVVLPRMQALGLI